MKWVQPVMRALEAPLSQTAPQRHLRSRSYQVTFQIKHRPTLFTNVESLKNMGKLVDQIYIFFLPAGEHWEGWEGGSKMGQDHGGVAGTKGSFVPFAILFQPGGPWPEQCHWGLSRL